MRLRGSISYVKTELCNGRKVTCVGADLVQEVLTGTPNFRATPFIVPTPCSYSRRICSNNSTFCLLFNRPPFQTHPGPKQSIRLYVLNRGAKSEYQSEPIQSSEISSMRTITQELRSITIGERAHFDGLTVFPLFRDGSVPPDGYTLLEEAIAAGSARVTEVSAGGSVPELRFENLGEKPVLLLDGEELIGAKQNRVVNLTILAPAKQIIVIPVSCVEAGRWDARTADFHPAEHVMYSRARAAKAAQVSSAMGTGAGRQSDQSMIWDEIALKSARLGANSPTQAMKAIYDSSASAMDGYLRAFVWGEQQVGLVYGIGPEAMGMDLMDNPYMMRAILPKLVRSYALDAVEAPHSAGVTPVEAAEFLNRIGKAEPLTRPAVVSGRMSG